MLACKLIKTTLKKYQNENSFLLKAVFVMSCISLISSFGMFFVLFSHTQNENIKNKSTSKIEKTIQLNTNEEKEKLDLLKQLNTTISLNKTIPFVSKEVELLENLKTRVEQPETTSIYDGFWNEFILITDQINEKLRKQ